MFIIFRLTEVENKLYDNRIIKISEAIDDGMACEVTNRLLAMDDDNHKPIKLYINSPGGSVNAGWEIIDTMNAIKSPVHTINTAMCASMASVILSFGEKRYSLPHARVMIHEVSSGVDGKFRDMKAALLETEKINKITMTALAENCGKTYEEIMQDAIRDLWFDAKESIEYGIIDEIITPFSAKKKRSEKN